MEKQKHLATLCVQAGWEPKNGESRIVPTYQSTTFKYDNTEEMADLFDLKKEGYFYTHRQLSDEQLRQTGIAPDLIRLSVGIEDVEDILADIQQALLAKS